MSLINCPECGKENVSDNAEMCPECGYGIKAHYEKIRIEQQKKEAYERRLQSVEMPEEPKRKKAWYVFAIICGIAGLPYLFVVPAVAIFLWICSGWLCYEGSKQYDEEMKKYNLAKSNFEKYQKEIVREEERQLREEALKPKCPKCNSTNIEKISTANRAVSIAMVGIASSKIGKQYKCNKCKHMW